MKNKALIPLIIFLLSVSCEDDKVKDNYIGTYPCCIQTSINNILSNPPQMPRSKIVKYYYDNQYVYSIQELAEVSDLLSIILNENCETVCESGGVAGLRCEGWDSAEFIELVWEDTR